MNKDELQLNPNAESELTLSNKNVGVVDPNNEYADMEKLALDAPLQFMAKYNSPREWILDERESAKAQIAFAPEDLSTREGVVGKVAYGLGNVVYETGRVIPETGQFLLDIPAAIEKTFFPNATETALDRIRNAVNAANQKSRSEREEIVSEFTADSPITQWTQAFADAATYMMPVMGSAKLAAKGVKTAATARKIPAARTAMVTEKAAEKAAGRAIVGTSLAYGLGSSSVESAKQYMEKTGAYDLSGYNPALDISVNTVANIVNANIEKSLGFDALVPHLYGSRNALLKGFTENLAKGFIGEFSEEGFQDAVSQLAEMVRGYRDWWDFDINRMAKNAIVGGIVGGTMGGGLYYMNRRAMIRKLENSGMSHELATNITDSVLTDGIEKTMNNLSAQVELNTQKGQAYEKLKAGIKNALLVQGWNEKMIDPMTGKPMNIDEYVELLANNEIARRAVREALQSGISIDEFLDVAQFTAIDNFMIPRPLGTPEQIKARIDEQSAIIKRQQELKKTGAGDSKLLSEAKMKMAILQKAYVNAKVNQEIQKVSVEEAKTPEIKKEIETAIQDADNLTKTDTVADFNENLDNKTQDGQPITTSQKIKRFGNAVIKKIFGKDKLGFDTVMTMPQYANARNAIVSSADRIFEFAKKHRTYAIYKDLRNALKLMQTVNADNFVEMVKSPDLTGNDVVAQNAFLYHFIFSDANTTSAFINAYLERAEASITNETGTSLSKKDLVQQAFQATDSLMSTQAQTAGIEYTSIYNEDGSFADENVAAVVMSYQNQFAVDIDRVTLYQPEQFDLANENARLDEIYPEYTGETITVDGKERPVYNSEGKRINKSAEALTNFWRWFGDSKVVDEQGRPLVVYHGTNVSNIQEFEGDQIYFSQFSDIAGSYGIGYDPIAKEGIEPYIYSVYLKIENPLNIRSLQDLKRVLDNINAPKDSAYRQMERMLSPGFNWDALDYDEKNLYASVENMENRAWTALYLTHQQDIIKYAKENGFDGILDLEQSNLGGWSYNGFIVFEPTQIKSVDNIGTYSEDTGNIYYQGRQANGFYDPELSVILLGKNWNTMTLPHELAHYWLDTLFNIYKRVQSGELQANQEWINEKKEMFAMLGIDENQTKLTKGQQEKFAAMTEAYLTGIGVSKDVPQTFKEYFKWVPEKYKSLQQLAYLDENNKVQNVFLDAKAVEFFNRWYGNPVLPSLSTSPERQRYMNVTGDDGEVQKVSIKEMNDREKEFAQDAEEQVHTDERLYNTLDENMPADIKPVADAQKVVISERSNYLKESENQQRRWYERKSRDTEAQLAQEYIEKNPEHAKEVIFGNPEFVPNDTGVDRATLINAYMALNNITPDKPEWAILHTNIAINQSLAGTQLALSNDKSYGAYLDALREVENALEMKAATNYAGSKTGARERFNVDIQRFLDRELPSIFATEPNSKEREIALKTMFEKARTTFSGNTTGTFLNQMDMTFAMKQKGKTEAFVKWATNQIKKDAGAKLNSEQQAKLLEISAKAQQALIDLNNPDAAKAVAAAQELRKWQVEKDKLMGVSEKKFSLFGFLFGEWAPRAMLASFNTLVVANPPSTALNTLAVNLAKRGFFGGIFGEHNVSKNLVDAEIKRIKTIWKATGMNLAQMEKPTSPSLLHGEKYSTSGQKIYDPYTILGLEDNLFRVPTFVNTLARIASTDAKATGRNADDVFKEYLSLDNPSDAAKLARKQALAVANMAVFTQDGALAKCLNHIRSELNVLSRSLFGLDPQGFGLGNLIAPFLKTGANIAEMGIRGSLAPITTITTMVNSWRTGKELDPMKKLALRMDWTYFAFSSVALALLAALTSDDDEFYTDPYVAGRKYDPDKPYDSINIGGVWLDLDFFGPFAIPMRTAAKFLQSWKKDNIGTALGKGYAESAKSVLGDIPLAESIINNQVSYAVKKPSNWGASYVYNQANKLVPAIVKPVSRAVSRGQGWEYNPDWLGSTVGRKFHRNYGFDGAELTTQDLIEILSTKFQLDESINKRI